LSQLKNKYYQNLLIQLLGIPLPAVVLTILLLKNNVPVYEVFQSYSISENVNIQLPIFGAMFLFASTLIIYALDFLRDIAFWQKSGVQIPKFGKLLAGGYVILGFVVIVGLIITMIKNGESKMILVGDGLKGFLNGYSAAIIVFIGFFVIIKNSSKKYIAILTSFIIALVAALSVFAPIYLISDLEGFKWMNDFIQPIMSYLLLFIANVITVSFFEKEKDAEGNTQNIWITNEGLAKALIFIIPTLMIILHWFFHWNIQQHSIFYVFAIYLFMYYFPAFFKKASVYRIVIDLALLLVCI
jgi:hypothetical protein